MQSDRFSKRMDMIRKLNAELFSVYDGRKAHHGANQYWFRKKIHGLSGCGPATSAVILSYMAQAFPEECSALYEHSTPAKRDEFTKFMQDVREYVKPGAMGLTDYKYFAEATIEYAKTKGVALKWQVVSKELSSGVAFGFIKRAVDERYMPALLILRNPEPELDEFTWHWMAVTGYDDEKNTVFISTYGEEYELDFEKVWNQQKPYSASCVYFFPDKQSI